MSNEQAEHSGNGRQVDIQDDSSGPTPREDRTAYTTKNTQTHTDTMDLSNITPF